MSLLMSDFEDLKRQIADATVVELPQVAPLRADVQQLRVEKLGTRQCHAIAFVATDGGENRLSFAPMNLEFLRVVDSEGTRHVQRVLPISAHPSIFWKYFEEIPVLKKFLERLAIRYEEVSYFLPTPGAIKAYEQKEQMGELTDEDRQKDPFDLRKYVRTFRDVLEWATLLELAWEPGRAKLLVLRDGLLRTKALKNSTVVKLAESFREAGRKAGSMIVGVAKTSQVLNYLSIALELEGTFRRTGCHFAEVPLELEKKAYKFDRTWIERQSLGGRMFLAKLAEDPSAPVFPVDLPPWLLDRRREVLEYLAAVSVASFPVAGYPEPLVRAHENAVVHGMELAVCADAMVKTVMEAHSVPEKDLLHAHIAFGRAIVLGGMKNRG